MKKVVRCLVLPVKCMAKFIVSSWKNHAFITKIFKWIHHIHTLDISTNRKTFAPTFLVRIDCCNLISLRGFNWTNISINHWTSFYGHRQYRQKVNKRKLSYGSTPLPCVHLCSIFIRFLLKWFYILIYWKILS